MAKRKSKLPVNREEKEETRMTRAAFTEVSHDFSWEVLLEMLRERWSDIPDSAHIEPSYNCESDVDQVTGITVLWSENERMVELL